MRIHICIILLFLIISQPLLASNTMILEGGSIPAGDTITIKIKINNDDPFVAFQSDIVLPPELQYVEQSAVLNQERAADHDLSASLLGGDTLRLFGYSTTNSTFSGDTGTVASFQLTAGTIPGNYTLPFSDALIGDSSSTNILTGKETNPITILAPDISLSSDSLDFGEIPLEDSHDKQITINNNGNRELVVSDIPSTNPRFSTSERSFTIAASSQKTLTIHYEAVVEEDSVSQLTIQSNDPDESESKVKTHVYAFAVNELHAGSFTAFSGEQATLSFSINNMEKFTGFQFDLELPDVLNYMDGSATLTQRSNGHSVSANTTSENELRVVAYSQSNENFDGNTGDIVKLDFLVEGTGGQYSLNLNDVIIGDSIGENIVSDYYNSHFTIAAPDINGNNTFDFGEVDITDSPIKTYSLENIGEDTLTISDVNFSAGNLNLQESLPVEILPDSIQNLHISYDPSSEGSISETMQIRSDDPDEDPFTVNISGNVFMPNYMYVRDTLSKMEDTVEINVNVENYETFVGFQFDLSFPSFTTCLTDQITLTSRANNHDLQISMIDSTTVRAFAYSMDMYAFSGNKGSVITIPLAVDTTGSGIFELTLSDALLGDENSEDILYEALNGQLTVSDLKINQVKTTDIQCYGTSTGKIEVDVSGGASPLSYTIDGGNTWQTNNIFSDLGTGSYTIKVKDNNGITQAYTNNPVVLEQPPELVIDSVSYEDVTGCYGDANGSIAIATSGGSGEIEYSIDGGSTWQLDSVFTGLGPGDYSAIVRDTNQCTTTYPNNPITLTQPEELVIDSVNVTNVTGSAGNSNGSIAVATTGGTGQLQYSIDNGSTWQADSIFTGLSAGDYPVAVKDENGCKVYFANNPVKIAEPGELIISSVDLTHVSGCFGDANGEIAITASGGTGSLQYTINGGDTWQNDNVFTGLPAGEYSIQVKDENENTTDYTNNPVVLKQPPELVIDSISYEDVTGCYGDANGSIAIVASGGTGALEHSIDAGDTWQSDSLFTGLGKGEYQITVKDQNGCIHSFQENPIVINAPDPLNINISASPDSTVCGDQEIELDATHPAAKEYYWEPSGKTDSIITVDSSEIGYDTQLVEVTVTDTNGCAVSDDIQIEFVNCTGIDPNEPLQFSVYPNPSSGKFFVELNGNGRNMMISIYNSLGKMIAQEKIEVLRGRIKTKFNLNHSSKGIYLMKINGENHSFTRKLIIQ